MAYSMEMTMIYIIGGQYNAKTRERASAEAL